MDEYTMDAYTPSEGLVTADDTDARGVLCNVYVDGVAVASVVAAHLIEGWADVDVGTIDEPRIERRYGAIELRVTRWLQRPWIVPVAQAITAERVDAYARGKQRREREDRQP